MSGELPKSWIWSTIGEVCHNPQYGWTTKASKIGSLQLVRTTDITSGTINWDSVPFCEKEPEDKEKYLLKDGDIIISRAGSVGYSLLIKSPQHSVFASYLIRFMPLTDRNFIAYFLKSPYYWNSISESKIGIAVPNVNATKLKQVSIPIAPLPEQHRIVAKIEELLTKLDAGVEALKQVQAQLKRYRQSVLKAAVEGRLTAEWREQYIDELEPSYKLLERIQDERKAKPGKKDKEPMPVDTSDLPELPEGWVWATWEQILSNEEGSFKRGPFGSSLKKSMFVKSGYKVYEQYCPINDDCSFARYFIKKEKFLEMKAFAVREKDFLVSCSGVTLGRITQVPKEYDAGIINQALLRVRINESVITSPFFIRLFRSPYFQKQIFARSTGSAIPNVKGVKELKAIPIPLPSLIEQRIIVSEIDRLFSILDKSESIVEYELKRATSLRQSILKHAFEGKLVPQDSSDEPASVLLERIKAEKAIQKKSKQMEMF